MPYSSFRGGSFPLMHVRSFTVWYAVSLSFLFRLSSLGSILYPFLFRLFHLVLCCLFLCICVLLPLTTRHVLAFFFHRTFLVYVGWSMAFSSVLSLLILQWLSNPWLPRMLRRPRRCLWPHCRWGVVQTFSDFRLKGFDCFWIFQFL